MNKAICCFSVAVAISSFSMTAKAGLFDSIANGLKQTVDTVNETANQTLSTVNETANRALSTVSNVVDVKVGVSTQSVGAVDVQERQLKYTQKLQVVPRADRAVNHDRAPWGQVLNVRNVKKLDERRTNSRGARETRADSREKIMKQSADFLAGEFKRRAEKLIERDGGANGERYHGSILRLWDRYVRVSPNAPCDRVYRNQFPDMPDLIESGGAVLPQSIESANSWSAAVRAALVKEEAFFDKRDEEVRIAKAKVERKSSYDRSRNDVRAALATFDGRNKYQLLRSGDQGRILAAMLESHPEILKSSHEDVSDVRKTLATLPDEPEDEAIQRLESLKLAVGKIKDQLMKSENGIKVAAANNRLLIEKLHADVSNAHSDGIKRLAVLPEIRMGDSLFEILCNCREEDRMVVRPNANEKQEYYGQTVLILPQSLATKELEGFQFEFGAFSETQEVFLVRAKYGYAQETTMQSAADVVKRGLPKTVVAKEDKRIVGYDEDELRHRSPWAMWQLSYYRERESRLRGKCEAKSVANRKLVDSVVSKYNAIPIYQSKIMIENNGYSIVINSHLGKNTAESVTIEDCVALDAVKVK